MHYHLWNEWLGLPEYFGNDLYPLIVIADDGARTAVEWSYDEDLGLATITTPPPSVGLRDSEGD